MSNPKWLAELKTTLQVAKARLNVRERKKTEQVAKERYTIADQIRNNRAARARIAVEHVIREDYKIEAMDRVEAYLDTLLMRMQLIKDRPKNGTVDPAVEQPLANILWAAPYLAQDIPELNQISVLFKKHFGQEYVSVCEQNKLSLVDADLLKCLSCDIVPKLLIEKYLVEICRSQNVPFEPDQSVMVQDEFWAIGGRYLQDSPTTNDEKHPPPSGGVSGAGAHGIGGGHFSSPCSDAIHPTAPRCESPPPKYSSQPPNYPKLNYGPSIPPPPPIAPSSNQRSIGFGMNNDVNAPFIDPFPRVQPEHDHVTPPTATNDHSDDHDFDDLTRRFEILKNRK